MHWTENWGWRIYCFGFTLITIASAVALFSPESPLYLYYHILMGFHPQYIYLYFLTFMSVLLTVVSLVPLYLFAVRMPFLSARLWQWIFVLRVCFETTGHYYEIQTLKAFAYHDKWLVFFIAVLFFSSLLPSYYAGFRYAFRRNQLFPIQ